MKGYKGAGLRYFLLHIFFLIVCILSCGCGTTNKSEFASLQEMIEKEEPYLPQEQFEEQLEERLNEYIYYEGGIAYETPLPAYKGESLDYAVLHQKLWDSEEAGYIKYKISVLLQPWDEKCPTSVVDLTVYNDSMYFLSYGGSPNRRIDFEDAEDVEESFSYLLGGSSETEKTKIWYTGTLTLGNGEEPQYSDFEEKKERVTEIYNWAENYLLRAEITDKVTIFVRDFREEDSGTEVLIEVLKNEEVSYLILPYYFFQENNFQKPLEIKDEKYFVYIEKLKKMSIQSFAECESSSEKGDNVIEETGKDTILNMVFRENKSNLVMAVADVDFGKYKDFSIKLIMTNGQYYTEEETAPAVGVYDENYDGQYILQVTDSDDNVIDQISLNEDWNTWFLQYECFPAVFC